MSDREQGKSVQRAGKSDSETVRTGAAGKSEKHPSGDLTVVGIGASAGGLDALQRMLPNLPHANIAYIIVQHLSPTRGSHLTSLLAKHTDMPVKTIEDDALVEPNTIFITPPNNDVVLSGNRLKLKPASPIGPCPSIDYFFNSLAEEKQAHAVGIILSGTGNDGVHGIRAIKSHNGIAMAQSIESAKFDGMPQATIGTGLVDMVLLPENIGRELEAAISYPHLIAKAPIETRDEVGSILSMLQKHSNIDFSEYKETTILRRIKRRMVIKKKENLKEYVDHINSNPEELTYLKKDLLISVTSFFRDSQAFEALAKKLKELLSQKQPGDSVRAWVPGCATGEEAYSIAILVAEILGQQRGKYHVQIFATDIDEDAIQLARKGVYPVATLMETDGRRFEWHFEHIDDTVKLKRHIRDMVVFARQDVTGDTPFLHLDLISCRNLMIYLNPGLQDRVLSLFQFSLNPKGLLFLGKSESINKRGNLFKPLDNRWKIYKRQESSPPHFPQLLQKRQMDQLVRHRENFGKQQRDDREKRATILFDAMLSLDKGCAVLTDSNAKILHVRGDVSPYFRFPEGNFDESISAIDAARPEIRNMLQVIFYKAAKKDDPSNCKRIALDDTSQGVEITVGTVNAYHQQNLRVIAFRPIEAPSAAGENTFPVSENEEERIRELEQELQVTHEHLQDTIEELETSSEELQSLNEELQSANEELQASNEELETSNEELQASNEELNTVNDELRAKSEEADKLMEELKASEARYRLLVENMSEALMLGELEYNPDNRPTDLIIRQVNPAFEKLMEIKRDFLPVRAGSAKLWELREAGILESFVEILKSGSPQQFDIYFEALDKFLYLAVYSLDDNHIGIACRDETERRRAVEALRQREANYRELVQNANSAIIRWNRDGTLTFFNEYAQRFFGYCEEEVLGKNVRILLPNQKSDEKDISSLVDDIVANPEEYVNNVNENICNDGTRVWMAWTNKPVYAVDGTVAEILAVGTDITKQRWAEERLEEFNQELEERVQERTELAEERARQLQALSVQLIEAEERERQRLAELLHDDLQQVLVSAKMQLEIVGMKVDGPVKPVVDSSKKYVVDAIAKSRRLAWELNPPILKHGGLVKALRWLRDHMQKQFAMEIALDSEKSYEFKDPTLNTFIFRAVQELLFNIAKHAGVKKADITLCDYDQGLEVAVTDEGKGFDSKILEKSNDLSGYGLISLQERTQSIGGYLRVESEPGSGTRAILRVPLNEDFRPSSEVQSVETAPISHNPPCNPDGASSGRIRVLFADDHEAMRHGLVSLVEKEPDIEVVGEAGDGQEAYGLARKHRPDVVLMDVSMPGMDGIESTRKIRSDLPEVLVVGLSMHDDGHVEEKMRQAGAVDFVHKTISSADLVARLRLVTGWQTEDSGDD